jgi:arabinofuranosyltransferase
MLRESFASNARQTGAERVGLALLCGAFAAAWWATAWICDDAFITLRTVDNALHGFGLVWNVGERVQTYTHPLWMLLVLLASAPHGELYFATLALGALCSAFALWLLIARIAVTRAGAAVALAALLGSRAFIDYASAGLENPLVHVLLGALLIACTRQSDDPRIQLARALAAACLLLTRLDLVFAAAPLCLGAWLRDGWPRSGTLLLATLPLLGWEVFSLVYYGEWIANSALAKLNAGVPIGERVVQGLYYLWATARWDPLSVLLLIGGPVAAVVARDPFVRVVALSIGAHLAWVVWVGGDFMSGRFLTPALFLSAALLARLPLARRPGWAVASGLAGLGLATPVLSPFAVRDYGDEWHAAIDERGVADERRFHLDSTALRAVLATGGWRSEAERAAARNTRQRYYEDPWVQALTSVGVLDEGGEWPPADPAAAAALRPVLVKGGVGLLGLRMGPELVIVDYHGLGDPLLARLPALPRDPVLASLIPRLAHLPWRVGHYLRPVPAGYVLSRATGENRIRDRDLAELYDTIRSVTSDPLWSAERFAAIRRLHSSWASERVERYVAHTPAYTRDGARLSVR